MSINPLTGVIIGATTPQGTTRSPVSSKLEAAVSALLNGGTAGVTDGADLSSSSQFSSQTANLYQAALNLSQNSSVVQTADQAISKQLDVVQQLQQLAQQASDLGLDSTLRLGLDTEFQSLLGKLNRIGGGALFNGQSLLQGTFTLGTEDAVSLNTQAGTGAAQTGTTQSGQLFPDLTNKALFDGATPNIQTPEDAQAASHSLQQAGAKLSDAQNTLNGVGQDLQFASANVESALFNQAAAGATLSDADFTGQFTDFTPAALQQAQSQALPPSILNLINQ
ncbi:MAG: hypothetical protein JO089_04795 [Alphaproteobacteria bacterium]|nr:hypothetical protein [Alphaproteobacteria bacterium]